MLPLPLQFIIAMVAYAINKQMARRIECLLEEVRVLREVYTETTGRKAAPNSFRCKHYCAVWALCHLSEGEMSRADPSVAVSTQHWEVGLQTRSIATRCVALRFAGCVASSSLRRVRARHVFLVLVAISKPIG